MRQPETRENMTRCGSAFISTYSRPIFLFSFFFFVFICGSSIVVSSLFSLRRRQQWRRLMMMTPETRVNRHERIKRWACRENHRPYCDRANGVCSNMTSNILFFFRVFCFSLSFFFSILKLLRPLSRLCHCCGSKFIEMRFKVFYSRPLGEEERGRGEETHLCYQLANNVRAGRHRIACYVFRLFCFSLLLFRFILLCAVAAARLFHLPCIVIIIAVRCIRWMVFFSIHLLVCFY